MARVCWSLCACSETKGRHGGSASCSRASGATRPWRGRLRRRRNTASEGKDWRGKASGEVRLTVRCAMARRGGSGEMEMMGPCREGDAVPRTASGKARSLRWRAWLPLLAPGRRGPRTSWRSGWRAGSGGEAGEEEESAVALRWLFGGRTERKKGIEVAAPRGEVGLGLGARCGLREG